jgi:MFS family permease
MRKQQVIALSVCNIVIYAGISGLVGLMPIYLTQLGADASMIGLFLATIYLSLAVSNVVAGRLADRFQHRKLLLILGGLAASPIAWLMSQAPTISRLLALLNATPWIGIVIGFGVGGVAIRTFQMAPALLLALVPSFLAIVLLTRIQTE